VFVVDAFHAMVSDRPYRHGMAESEARARLRSSAGSQFDPHVVKAFLSVLDGGNGGLAARRAGRA
jgi:HD-GYP domain-containing protein (c-di-GMP phosphodiesterase class II)